MLAGIKETEIIGKFIPGSIKKELRSDYLQKAWGEIKQLVKEGDMDAKKIKKAFEQTDRLVEKIKQKFK